MQNLKRLLVLAIVLLVLTIVGCAITPTTSPAASPSGGGQGPSSTSSATGEFDGTIVLGAAISLTGATSNEGRYARDGYELAKDAINAAGGIRADGKRFKMDIKYYDDASTADRTGQLVEKLINEDKVNFLLGPYGSGPTGAAAAVAEKYKVPMVEGNGAAESIFSHGLKYTFGILSPGRMYLRGILDLVKAKDPSAKKVAIIAETDTFASEVADGAAAYAKDQGFEVVYKERYATAAKDITPQLTAIKGLNPDIILGAGHLQDAVLTMKQAKEIGVNAKAWGFSVGPSTPEFRNSLKKDADYVTGGAQWTEKLNLKGDDVFRTPQDFARQGRAKFSAYESTVPYQVAESAASVIAYQKGIQAAGTLDPVQVRDALARLNFDSFFGHIQLDDRGINVYKSMAVEQNQTDGRIYTIGPAGAAEKGFEYPAPPWNQR